MGSAEPLAGQVALVTGGASGIGAAVVARLLADGAGVAILDLATTDDPPATRSFAADVADAAAVQATVQAVLDAFGRLDILVNAAGVAADRPVLETEPEQFDRIVAVNLRGTFLCCRAVVPAMIRQGGGRIVNIASVSGISGHKGRSAYGASKGGVITLTRVLAVELGPHGIRVNAVAPGPIDTPLVRRIHDAATRRQWTEATALGRYGTPEEVAGPVAFLAGPDAAYVTGTVLVVDGGVEGTGLKPARGEPQ